MIKAGLRPGCGRSRAARLLIAAAVLTLVLVAAGTALALHGGGAPGRVRVLLARLIVGSRRRGTAETIEAALSADGQAILDGPCAGTSGTWCARFLAQPLVSVAEKPLTAAAQCPAGRPRNFSSDPDAPARALLSADGPQAAVLCSGNGVCNAAAGRCHCVAWMDGDAVCGTPLPRRCNWPRDSLDRPEDYSGPASKCPGVCDDRLGHCFCPHGMAGGGIGGRPLLPGCRPSRYDTRLWTDLVRFTVWTAEQWEANATAAPDGTTLPHGNIDPEKLFGDPAIPSHAAMGITAPGWCAAVAGPEAGRTPPSVHCSCEMEGMYGSLCEQRAPHMCLNDCAGHGRCEHGFCWCQEGFFGTDCSMRLNAARAMYADDDPQPGTPPGAPPAASSDARADAQLAAEPAAVQPPPAPLLRRRPFIYVYELPPQYNVRLLSYRVNVRGCAHRRFVPADTDASPSGGPAVRWHSGQPGYLDFHLHEALLRSPHRTLDPASADFYYVPLYLTCLLWPVASYAEHPTHHRGALNRQHNGIRLVQAAARELAAQGPYWQRAPERHIWYFGHDEGACWAPLEIWPSILLSHWGRMETFPDGRPVSSSAYGADNYDSDEATRQLIGAHPCYDAAKDLLLPPYTMHAEAAPMRLREAARRAAGEPAPARPYLLAFLGTTKRECETPARCYSRGIRQKVAELMKDRPGMAVRSGASSTYSRVLSESLFCLVAPGDGFSTRLEDAVLHGCIPVVIMDNTLTAWGTLLAARAYSLRVAEADIPQLETTLRAVTLPQREALQAGVAAVTSRFDWTSLYRWPWRPLHPPEAARDPLSTLMAALYAKL